MNTGIRFWDFGFAVVLTSRSQWFRCGEGRPGTDESRACNSIVPERLGFECQPGSVSGCCISGVGHGVSFHYIHHLTHRWSGCTGYALCKRASAWDGRPGTAACGLSPVPRSAIGR